MCTDSRIAGRINGKKSRQNHHEDVGMILDGIKQGSHFVGEACRQRTR